MPAERPCAPGQEMPAERPCAPGAPDAAGAREPPRAPGPEPRLASELLPELYSFAARVLFCLAPVYLAGYLGLSVTWLLLGALLWRWWRRNRRGKLGRLAAAFEFLDNERQFISRELLGQHLPAWVSPRAGGGQGGVEALGEAARRERDVGPAGGRSGEGGPHLVPHGPPRAAQMPWGRDRAPPAHVLSAPRVRLRWEREPGFHLRPRAWEGSHGRATPGGKQGRPRLCSYSGGNRLTC